ncbi:transposase [Xanthomonas populi]|nr:transposase [Xanthomonas populi]
MSFANEENGIAALIQVLQDAAPRLMVLEATGGLERTVVAKLLAAALLIAVINHRQVRAFAKVSGQHAKTDRLDACLLAHVAQAIQPAQGPLSEAAMAFADHLARRR